MFTKKEFRIDKLLVRAFILGIQQLTDTNKIVLLHILA